MTDLSAIRELCEKATGGPWYTRYQPEHPRFPAAWELNSETVEVLAQFSDDEDGLTDAQFCAHARQLIPLLLDEVEAWRERAEATPGTHAHLCAGLRVGEAAGNLDANAAKLKGGGNGE